jgi:ATP-dependent RNA helicase DeaD
LDGRRVRQIGHVMTSSPTPESDFDSLGLRPELLQALAELGYEEATPIQREAIPQMIAGHDVLGQAATGTGKTAAFALPALNAIDPAERVPTTLVLVPTRELAMQVSEACFRYGRHLGAVSVPVYGGQPIYRQLQTLDRGAHIVVGTPGRVIDHIGRGSLPLTALRTVVLDEADEMLDMGFADDIESILDSVPSPRQTVLFSATMPPRIAAIAKRHLQNPVRITIEGRAATDTANVRQTVYVVPRAHKPAALGRILDVEAPEGTLVFCRTRTEVDQLTETMNLRGYRAEALHGGMDQAQRDRVMGRLREGTADLLVATDVAARGLDVDTLTHVVNYDVPSAAESYVHRIGRVGRAGRSGVAITLAEPREQRLLANIERLTKQTMQITHVPSVADLRARQIELTVDAVREALSDESLDDYQAVLTALAGDGNLRLVALAAIKLAHEARGAVRDEAEIPDAADALRRQRTEGRGDGRAERGGAGARHRSDDGPTGYVYIGLGRSVGIRPADLVGAIANETGLEGRSIGPIKITDRFAVVGVPADQVPQVIDALRNSTIKGKKPNARPYTPDRNERTERGPRPPIRAKGRPAGRTERPDKPWAKKPRRIG